MVTHPRPQIIASVHGLDHARGENVADYLGKLDDAVGGIWRRLRDDAVAREQGGDNLADCENERVVPWADSSHDADGAIGQREAKISVVLDDFWLRLRQRGYQMNSC